jgi:hypothetical protein
MKRKFESNSMVETTRKFVKKDVQFNMEQLFEPISTVNITYENIGQNLKIVRDKFIERKILKRGLISPTEITQIDDTFTELLNSQCWLTKWFGLTPSLTTLSIIIKCGFGPDFIEHILNGIKDGEEEFSFHGYCVEKIGKEKIGKEKINLKFLLCFNFEIGYLPVMTYYEKHIIDDDNIYYEDLVFTATAPTIFDQTSEMFHRDSNVTGTLEDTMDVCR